MFKKGDKAVFRSTSARDGYPGYRDRSGQTVVIVGPLIVPDGARKASYAEYRIRFADGNETEAFDHELTPTASE